MTLFLAQTDPLSGGAGWVGAGLLGAVLAWLLLKHLPEKDRQVERLIEKHDATEAILAATFKAEMAAERSACEKHFESLTGAMRQGNETVIRAFESMGNQSRLHNERDQQHLATIQAALAKQGVPESEIPGGKAAGGGAGGEP